jgi:hypothetical protein
MFGISNSLPQQRAKTTQSQLLCFTAANPTIASYNAGVVKIYSAVNSMARFGSRFFGNDFAYDFSIYNYNASVVVS